MSQEIKNLFVRCTGQIGIDLGAAYKSGGVQANDDSSFLASTSDLPQKELAAKLWNERSLFLSGIVVLWQAKMVDGTVTRPQLMTRTD